MKKNTILIIALLLICGIHTPGRAQLNPESRTSAFGVKVGANSSNLYTNDESDSQMLAGFNLGLFSKLSITHFLAVQPEIYFTTKGAEVTYDNLVVDGTARFRLNYIEVPLLLVINITPNLNLQAGPYAAYLISGKSTNESNVNIFDFENNIDTNDFNRFEAGIALGAGIDIGGISLGARYYYGLTNVGKEKTFLGIAYTLPDATNGLFNIYVSFCLN